MTDPVLAIGIPALLAIAGLMTYAQIRNNKERKLGNSPWPGSIPYYMVMCGIMLLTALAIWLVYRP